ncbi:RHS repeat domain-containing protein [Martelella alba]|uniref:RHS repeat-associated core domain-containing protein n=1 Tax=Martelella alba TaxID=2590451 RepID=A0ABY2SPB3_9HYPH|nr:RHS repeat-associated core domain-containing protein [Martelella alba]TKI07779.1 RHS repeat-associated core domain-containing protein [Martelella alba]
MNITSIAANFSEDVQNHVDLRTGQFISNIIIYRFEPKNGIGGARELRLSFTPATSSDLSPYGIGWSMNIPFYDDKYIISQDLGRLGTLSGQFFDIKVGWESMKNTILGHHQKDLMLWQINETTCHLYSIDGVTEILAYNDYLGVYLLDKLVMENGETYYFYYRSNENNPSYITDHEGRIIISFHYLEVAGKGPFLTHINFIEGDKDFLLKTEYDELNKLNAVSIEPVNSQRLDVKNTISKFNTSYLYHTLSNDLMVISDVFGPLGAHEIITYDENAIQIDHDTTLAAVNSWTTLPNHDSIIASAEQGIKRVYKYGPFIETSGGLHFQRNFTGFPLVINGYSHNDLLESIDDSYTYYVTETFESSTNPPIYSQYVYNRFHLLTEKSREQDGNVTKTTYDYFLLKSNTPYSAQPPGSMSSFKEHTVYSDMYKNNFRKTLLKETRCDEFGNVIEYRERNMVTRRIYKDNKAFAQWRDDGYNDIFKRNLLTEERFCRTGNCETSRDVVNYDYDFMPALNNSSRKYFVMRREETRELFGMRNDKIEIRNGYSYQLALSEPELHGRTEKISSIVDTLTSTATSTQTSEQRYLCNITHYRSGQKIYENRSFDFTGKGQTLIFKFVWSLAPNRLLSITSPEGREIVYEYDIWGNLTGKKVAEGSAFQAKKSYLFQKAEDISELWTMTITDSLNQKYRILYDGLGRISKKWDVNNSNSEWPLLLEEYIYNDQNQLIQKVKHDYHIHDLSEGVAEAQSSTTHIERYIYDYWGNMDYIQLENGVKIFQRYNPIENTRINGIEGSNLKRYTYNAYDRETEVAKLSGLTDWDPLILKKKIYDKFGRLSREFDDQDKVTTLTYDMCNRISRIVVRGRNRKITSDVFLKYVSSTSTSLTSHVRVNGRSIYSAYYDDYLQLTDAYFEGVGSGPRERYSYHENNPFRLKRIVKANGEYIEYQYHPSVDEVIKEKRSLLHENEFCDYDYDPQTGNVTSLITQVIPITSNGMSYDTSLNYTYNSKGFPSNETTRLNGNTINDIDMVYSLNGVPYSMRNNIDDFYEKFSYKSSGELTSIEINSSTELMFEYALPVPQIAKVTIYNKGVISPESLSISYDKYGDEYQRTYFTAHDRVLVEVSRNANSSLSSVDTKSYDHDTLSTIVYDNEGRISQFVASGSLLPRDESGREVTRQDFSYDNFFNLKSISSNYRDNGRATTHFHYNQNHCFQLEGITGPESGFACHITYNSKGDAIGNLQAINGIILENQYFEYNGLGKLKRWGEHRSNRLFEYYYDPLGRLLRRVDVNRTSSQRVINLRHFNDKVRVIKSDQSGDEGNVIGYLGDTPLMGRRGREQTLFCADSESSIIMSGRQELRCYLPFGFTQTGDVNPLDLLYKGELYDRDCGIYHLGARPYDVRLKRFLTPDSTSPLGVGGINPYIYCYNDPVNRNDHSGLAARSIKGRISQGVDSPGELSFLLSLVSFAFMAFGPIGAITNIMLRNMATLSAMAGLVGATSGTMQALIERKGVANSPGTRQDQEFLGNLNVYSTLISLAISGWQGYKLARMAWTPTKVAALIRNAGLPYRTVRANIISAFGGIRIIGENVVGFAMTRAAFPRTLSGFSRLVVESYLNVDGIISSLNSAATKLSHEHAETTSIFKSNFDIDSIQTKYQEDEILEIPAFLKEHYEFMSSEEREIRKPERVN